MSTLILVQKIKITLTFIKHKVIRPHKFCTTLSPPPPDDFGCFCSEAVVLLLLLLIHCLMFHPLVCGGSVFGLFFCYTLLSVLSRFANILWRTRGLSSNVSFYCSFSGLKCQKLLEFEHFFDGKIQHLSV